MKNIASGLFLFLSLSLWGESADNLYTAGTRAFQQEYYKVAAGYFQQLVDQYPSHHRVDDSLFLEGLSFFYLKDYRKTILVLKDFELRLGNSPLLSKVNYWRGAAWFYLEEYKNAADALEVQTGKYGDVYFSRSAYLLGLSYQKLGRYSSARKTFKAVLERGEEGSLGENVQFQLASSAFSDRDWPDALTQYTALLVNYPSSPLAFDASFYIAECYYQLEETNQALKRYLAIYEQNPGSVYREKLLFRLAFLYLKQEAYGDSYTFYSLLEKEFPRGMFRDRYKDLKGYLLFYRGDYSGAVEVFESLLEQENRADEAQIRFNLALSYWNMEIPRKALGELEKVLAFSGLREQGMIKMVEIYLSLEEDEKALEVLARLGQEFPESRGGEDLLRVEAQTLMRLERFREAEKRWSRLIREYTGSFYRDEYLYRRGECFRTLGDYKSALGDFNEIITLFPYSSYLGRAYYAVGYVYTLRGEYTRALPYYEYVRDKVSDAPLVEQAELALGVSYYNLEDWSRAREILIRLTREARDRRQKGLAFLYLGKARSRLDRLMDALEDFQSAALYLDRQPEGGEAYYLAGWTAFRLDRIVPARDAFLKGARDFPSYEKRGECYYRAALCEGLLENWEASNACLDLAEKEIPREKMEDYSLEEEILYRRGQNWLALGKPELGLEQFRRLKKKFPGSLLAGDAFYQGAEALFNKEQWSAASGAFREVIAQFPGTSYEREALFRLGRAQVMSGAVEEGIGCYLDYLERFPEDEKLFLLIEQIKEAFAAAGNPELVQSYFDRAMARNSLSPEVKDLLRFEYAYWLFDSDFEAAYLLLDKLNRGGVGEPVKSRVNLLIGEYFEKKGNWERAFYIYKGIADSSSGETGAAAQLKVGDTLVHMERYEQAVEEYLKIRFLFPDLKDYNPRALYRAYKTAGLGGFKEDEARFLKELQAEFPEFLEARP